MPDIMVAPTLLLLFSLQTSGVTGSSVTPPISAPALLLETGDYILLETGDKILLES